jgi:transporter family-2 protein
MTMGFLSLLALIAGAAIATQVSMNAQLGVLLKNSLLGTTVVLTSS